MLISVIIPTYNRPDVLIKTIDSYILSLKHFNSEIVIVDDGSNLSYIPVIKKLKDLNINFKYIKNKKRLGLPLARNIGLNKITPLTKYVFFGEDDVFIIDDTIKIMIEVIENYQLDIVGCNVKYLEDYDYQRYLDRELKLLFPQKYKDIFKLKSINIAKSEIYKKLRFDVIYIINSYREETDFFISAFKNGYKIGFITNYLAFNLPRKDCNYGGEWSIHPLVYECASIYNNIVFHLKHFKFLIKQTSVLEIIKEVLKFSYYRVRIMILKLVKRR